MLIKQEMPETCSTCERKPYGQVDGEWMCKRCYQLWWDGKDWAEARANERKRSKIAYASIRKAHAEGYPETAIAALMGVDRMTVRRALGKR